jgi:hypothetical protein
MHRIREIGRPAFNAIPVVRDIEIEVIENSFRKGLVE